MRIVRIASTVAACGLGLALVACGDTKLLGKSLPDETQVIDGPTLALPPQFDLRPPREAADYETMLRAQKGIEAQNLIVTGSSSTTVTMPPADGVTTTQTSEVSASVPSSDQWLVNKSAAQTGVVADPNVRTTLQNKYPEDLKAAEDAKAKKGLFGRWFGSSDDE